MNYHRRSDMLLHHRGRDLCRIGGIPITCSCCCSGQSRQIRSNRRVVLVGIRLVASIGLGTVEVAVHAGIDLVQHVRLMRASCMRSRASGATKSSGCTGMVAGSVTRMTGSAAVIAVRIDARVSCVGQTTVVLAICTLRSIVTSSTSGAGIMASSGRSGDATSMMASGIAKTSGCASVADGTTVVAVRIDARVGSVSQTVIVLSISAFGSVVGSGTS